MAPEYDATVEAADSASPSRSTPNNMHLSPLQRWAAGLAAGILVILTIFAILFQWNWLRAPLAGMISARLDRPVAITGNLEVHPWSWSPRATVNGLVIGNPRWAGSGPMATLSRVTVQMKLLSLMKGKLVLPLIKFERPDVRLMSDASGRSNWTFGENKRRAPLNLPTIERLVVDGGVLRLDDAQRRLSFVGGFSSNEGAAQVDGGLSRIDGTLSAGAASWAGATPTLRVPRLLIELKALPLLTQSKLVLPLVEADHAVVRLLRDASGRESWNLTGGRPKAFKAPVINHLVISDGSFQLDDRKRSLHVAGVLSSSEEVNGAGQGTFHLDGKGLLNAGPFVAHVTSGPLLYADPKRPYPFDAKLIAGPTRLRLAGTIARPFDFAVLSGELFLTGPDLADLYPLTGLALPRTPPYQLAAGFARADAMYALRGIQGRVGRSDLTGSVSVNDASGRPFLKANLASRRLRLSDLAAVVGGVPNHSAGQPLSPTQKVVAARLRAEHRLLPDVHLDVSRARGMDAKVEYKAESVDAGNLPIHSLEMDVSVDHGVITANPFDMTLPQGRLAGTIRIDGRGAVPNTAIDMRLTNARLETLVNRGVANSPLEGGVFAHVKVAGAGDSVRAAAANLGGTMTVAIPGGKIRRSFAELLGIDVAKGLYLLLTNNQGDAPIRCGIADFRAKDGVLTTQRIVFDTGPVLVKGGGEIDLRDETLNFRVQGVPKGFHLLRLNAPITVKGSLQAPKVGVDLVKAVPQVLLSVAVGALAAPAAAIVPFLHGPGPKDVDCSALMAQAAGAGIRVGGH